MTSGDFRKKSGKVIGVDRKKFKIHVEGITREKAGAKEAGKSESLWASWLVWWSEVRVMSGRTQGAHG